MSTNAVHYGSGSIVSSRANGFTPTGSPRPSRPGQIDPGLVEGIAGGADPSEVSEMSHASAAALLDRVHHTADPEVVARVLTLVDREGVDVIAELWSRSEPDSLPGILWRLYLLRSWMRQHDASIARLWRVGEPVATAASAIAGVDAAPTEDDIARTADSILAGAFTGDFAVALERAAAFTDVVALGLRVEAKRLSSSSSVAAAGVQRQPDKAARLLHTASNLMVTARDFRHGASLWRRGKLD
ncbi:thymidine phosphorylase [Bifidobacterium biavatii DSM 23969]|uniref:Thymidine phosphorylase n=1 Tax=Bifidobacterium biavatii DSM 23969 TaxID=1437608 RepID=A0A086ZN93_9BIFI|nr:thymidine phosphorylase [Bifidobacterium biavatii DSM 23969]